MAVIDSGSDVAGKANVDAENNLQVNSPGFDQTGVKRGGGPENAGAVAFFSENDPGEITGQRFVASPETDSDYRLRVALDHMLDRETFNYAAQNTGKHYHAFTTVTATVSINGLLVNSGSGVASATGMTFGSFAAFPAGMGAAALYVEQNVALNLNVGSIPSNVVFDIGAFYRGASQPWLPTDGVYFRFTSAGIQGVINNNGTETLTTPFTGVDFLANENHKYNISISEKEVLFWIDDVLMGRLVTPIANGQAFRSTSLPWSLRFANTGAVGQALQVLVTDYTISHGGPAYQSSLAEVGNRTLGSYQGLSGGTPGGLSSWTNSALPTAAVPSNTVLTANLINGLGGQAQETDTLAVNTDGIIMSYLNPAGTPQVQGRRLVITGVWIDSVVSAALTGGGYVALWALAFGHTAVSMATAETASFATATTKKPRILPLGSHAFASGAALGVGATPIRVALKNPVYVNPGEYVALTRRKVGTAPSAGTIYHMIGLDYGWE